MKIIQAKDITEKVAKLCIQINTRLTDDIDRSLTAAQQKEAYPLAKNILSVINENRELAANNRRPICQDTGMVIAFVQCGQDVHITGGSL